MLITDPSAELQDARIHWVDPFKMWDWVAASETEPCFIVAANSEALEAARPFSTAIISSVDRLIQYAVVYLRSRCKVYKVERVEHANGASELRFPPVLGLGKYEGIPEGIPYYAHFNEKGIALQTYEAQPPITEQTKIQILALFG